MKRISIIRNLIRICILVTMAIRINLNIFKKFVRSGAIGGVMLLFCVIISLLVANSSWGAGFERLLLKEIGFASPIQLRYSVLQWINDGLMAIFFLFVGLEIKRELVEGELSSRQHAILPVFAAIGGAIVPAVIYSLFNQHSNKIDGWGIPMATDIAFAIGVLSLLGKRVPVALKIFLAALAIVDDLIAILVIALFYSAEIHFDHLLYASGVFSLMLVFNRLNLKNLLFYIIPGLFLWYFIHHSGIHATIAGVLTALTIPTTKDAVESPLEKLEHFLARPVNFIIMPVFALANTNIRFEEGMLGGLYGSLGLGIIFGLFLGKPIGITLMSWLIVKLGWGKLPGKVRWGHIVGIGLLGGIGFTMSIFIALLSFRSSELQAESKVAVLVASTFSAVAGCLLLSAMHRKRKKTSS